MQLVKIEKKAKPTYTIDWHLANSISLEEKMNYFVTLAEKIVRVDVEDPVEVGEFIINKRDKKVYYTCLEEYINCMNKLERQAFIKKVSLIAHNFSPKKMYNSIKNRDFSSMRKNAFDLITTCFERKTVISGTVAVTIFVSTIANGMSNKSASQVYASTNDTQFVVEESALEVNMPLSMSDVKVEEVSSEKETRSIDLTNDFSNSQIHVVSSLITESPPTPNKIKAKDTEQAGDTEEINPEYEAFCLKYGLYTEKDNYEIKAGYHYTWGNLTYDVSNEEFLKIIYLVEHESNKTYEDGLGVISVVLNRMEDNRYEADNLIDIISAEGQFTAYNETKALAFARSSNPSYSKEVYNAVSDALYLGIRNNDYVEFKSSDSSPKARDGEEKYQIVPDGNKYHNLAQNLQRRDIYLECIQKELDSILDDTLDETLDNMSEKKLIFLYDDAVG